MTGSSYRVPCEPVAPGAKVPGEAMCIIEAMPVKSLITAPGRAKEYGQRRLFQGAWSGAGAIAEVALSTDFGASWQGARRVQRKIASAGGPSTPSSRPATKSGPGLRMKAAQLSPCSFGMNPKTISTTRVTASR